MKDTGLNWYVYIFSVDYDTTAVDDMKDIHKYLIKKVIKSDKHVSKKRLAAKWRIKNV